MKILKNCSSSFFLGIFIFSSLSAYTEDEDRDILRGLSSTNPTEQIETLKKLEYTDDNSLHPDIQEKLVSLATSHEDSDIQSTAERILIKYPSLHLSAQSKLADIFLALATTINNYTALGSNENAITFERATNILKKMQSIHPTIQAKLIEAYMGGYAYGYGYHMTVLKHHTLPPELQKELLNIIRSDYESVYRSPYFPRGVYIFREKKQGAKSVLFSFDLHPDIKNSLSLPLRCNYILRKIIAPR